MKVCAQRFNHILVAALLAWMLCGCLTNMRNRQPMAALSIYLEFTTDNAAEVNGMQSVSVLRSSPVLVTIAREPILTEANVVAAKVINTPEAPAIEIRFDENGTWILEQYSATNPGRHFVINGKWGEKLKESRYLAAPLITRRIANGILSFTPDMSREEANQFVLGLNNYAKQFQTKAFE